MRYCTTLTIAGSDCSGGAGIQADIKTMSALGCYASSVVTAITAQNTLGVYAIQHVKPSIIAAQLRAVMEDIRPDAIKVGMIVDGETIEVIKDILQQYKHIPLIVDPVMVSSSGSKLIEENAIAIFLKRLVPITTLLTPNIPEIEVLAKTKPISLTDFELAAQRLLNINCNAVLIKGGHREESNKVDYLFRKEHPPISFSSPTVETHNTHGTGCTLSSAITAFMARGLTLEKAIQRAKEYLTQALKAGAGITIGQGHGAVNHFYNPKKIIKQ